MSEIQRNGKEMEIMDFGFSAMSEEELKRSEKAALDKKSTDLSQAQIKLLGLKNMIFPFLDGLAADPTKPFIHWPNRLEKLQEFKKRIELYIGDGA